MHSEASRIERGSGSRSERNPDQTRRLILAAAYEAMYRHGYQGMRLDKVLTATGLTKGAFYHHFRNKQAVGYAVVDELLAEMVDTMWVSPLQQAANPLDTLEAQIRQLPAMGESLTTLGCPLNNLAQEMSPLDEGFRVRIDALFMRWHASLAAALERGKAAGQVSRAIDSGEVATFLLASLEGCIGMAKNSRSIERLRECGNGLMSYINLLRA